MASLVHVRKRCSLTPNNKERTVQRIDQIKSVIDRVLWTAEASTANKQLLAEAIEEELGKTRLLFLATKVVNR